MCIAIGYAVIVSYVLKALVDSVTGTLMTVDTASWFQAFSTKDFLWYRTISSWWWARC